MIHLRAFGHRGDPQRQLNLPKIVSICFTAEQVLELDDLKSDSHSESTFTGDTIPIVSQNSTEHRLPSHTANINKFHMKKERKIHSGIDRDKDHDIHFSDLENTEDTCSPGAIPMLNPSSSSALHGSSSILNGVQKGRVGARDKGGREGRGKQERQRKKSGVGKRGREERESGGEGGHERNQGPALPLLKMATEDSHNNWTGPSLEQVFPELVDNLRKFDLSVMPAWKNKNIDTRVSWSHEAKSDQSQGFPLLHLPQEADSLPGRMSHVHPQPPHPPYHPPSPHPPSLGGLGEFPQIPLLTIPQSIAGHSRGGVATHQILTTTMQPSLQTLPHLKPTHSHSNSAQHIRPSNVPNPPPPHLPSTAMPPHPSPHLPVPTQPSHISPASHPLYFPPPLHVPLYSQSSCIPLPPQVTIYSTPQLLRAPEVFPMRPFTPLLISPDQLLQQQEKLQNLFGPPDPPRLLKVDDPFVKMTGPKLESNVKTGDHERTKLKSKDERSGSSFQQVMSSTSLPSTSLPSAESISESKSTSASTPQDLQIQLPNPQKRKKVKDVKEKKRVHKRKQLQESVNTASSVKGKVIGELPKGSVSYRVVKENTSPDEQFEEENIGEADKGMMSSRKVSFGSADTHLVSTEGSDQEVIDFPSVEVKLSGQARNTSDEKKKASSPIDSSYKKPLSWSSSQRDFPDRLEPLESLEIRRLNLCKIEDKPTSSTQRSIEEDERRQELEATFTLQPSTVMDKKVTGAGREESLSSTSSKSIASVLTDPSPHVPVESSYLTDSSITLTPPTNFPPPNTANLATDQVGHEMTPPLSHLPPINARPSSPPSQHAMSLQPSQSSQSIQYTPISQDSQSSLSSAPSQASVPSQLSPKSLLPSQSSNYTSWSQQSQEELLSESVPPSQPAQLQSTSSVDSMHSPKAVNKHTRTVTLPQKSSDLVAELAEDNSQITRTSSHVMDVGFDCTPPVPLPGLSKDELERGKLSLQLLLSDMKSGSGKKEAMESLLQLEEQLSALESTVRVMEGGFKQSNKILQTIDHLTSVSDTIGRGSDTIGRGAGAKGIKRKGIIKEERDMDHISSDSSEDSLLYSLQEVYHTSKLNVRGEVRKEGGEVRVGGGGRGGRGRVDGRKGGRGERKGEGQRYQDQGEGDRLDRYGREKLEEKSQLHEDTRIAVLDNERRVGTGREKKKSGGVDTVSTMVLYRGERWGKEELRKWMEKKKRGKLEDMLDTMESRKSRRREQTRNKPKLKSRTPQFKRTKSFLEEVRSKRVAEAYSLMTDILASQKVPIPNSCSPPPRNRVRNTLHDTFSIPHGGVIPTTGCVTRRDGHVISKGGHVISKGGHVTNSHVTDTSRRREGNTAGTNCRLQQTKKHSPADYNMSAKRVKFSHNKATRSLVHTHSLLNPPLVSISPTPLHALDQSEQGDMVTMTSLLEAKERNKRTVPTRPLPRRAHEKETIAYDGGSVSSGSIMSNIDWDEVDRILEN